MVYHKGTCDPTNIFLHMRKISCLMPIWNNTFQNRNQETRTSSFTQMRGPPYPPWRRHSKRGNPNSTLLSIHVNSWDHRLAMKSKGILPRMKQWYFWSISQVDKNKPFLFGCCPLVCWLRPVTICLWFPQFSGRKARYLFWSSMYPLVRLSSGVFDVSLLEERRFCPSQWRI